MKRQLAVHRSQFSADRSQWEFVSGSDESVLEGGAR
jgi:hypothetical protein